ncbi:MAG: hypothetical protein AAF270_06090 [Pseudomonadota bacterium]
MNKRYISLLLAVAITPVHAEQYDFEAFAQYQESTTSSRVQVFGQSAPAASIEQTTDTIRLGGTWFFDGLTIAAGPRSQAAFLDRASSISLAYADGSTDTDVENFNVGSPIIVSDVQQDIRSFDASTRYVWQNTGWFATGQYSVQDLDVAGIDFDTTVIGAGFGKYIGERTTLALTALRGEIEVSDGASSNNDVDTGVAIGAKHLGDLGSTWDYAAEVSVSNQSLEGSSGSYGVTLSLFPNRDITLRSQISGQLGSSALDATRYSLSAGWFVIPALEISAEYNWVSVDEDSVNDPDTDGFGFRARYRF